MPDKKLTDAEIKKALDICSKSTNGCSHSKYTCEDCYLNGQPMCSAVLLQDAIDCFNRLQAENEKKDKNYIDLLKTSSERANIISELSAECERLRKSNEMFTDIGKLYSEIKAEAHKEFAERLKEKIIATYNEYDEQEYPRATITDIDNLFEELEGAERHAGTFPTINNKLGENDE